MAAVLLSIAVIVVILYTTIDAESLARLAEVQIRYEFFVLAAAVNVLAWFIWGARLMLLANTIERHSKVGLWMSTKIVIANLFLAGVTPSLAGGEPVRIYLLTREGKSLGGATASVLGERLLDAIFILATVPIALVVFRGYITDPLFQGGIAAGIVVFSLAIVLFVYAILFPEKTKHGLIRINAAISRLRRKDETDYQKRIVARISSEVDNFHQAMMFYFREGKWVFLVSFGLTVAYWLVSFSIASLLLMGLGYPPFVVQSFAAQMLLLILVMMPTTPGSSGVTEGGTYGLYVVLIGTSLIGVFVLLFRFVTYYMNLIAGAVFQFRFFRALTAVPPSLSKTQSMQERQNP